jgi:hypothetical protein
LLAAAARNPSSFCPSIWSLECLYQRLGYPTFLKRSHIENVWRVVWTWVSSKSWLLPLTDVIVSSREYRSQTSPL